VPLLKTGKICLICFGVKSGVIFDDVVSPGYRGAAIVFRRVLRCSSVSSNPAGDGPSCVVGLGVLSSVRALSNTSSSDERSRISAKGSILSLVLVSVLCVCYVLLVGPNQILQFSPL